MLILRMPKLYRLIKKIKIKEYRKGWRDCAAEKDSLIKHHVDDKKHMQEELIAEFNRERAAHKSEIQNLQEEHGTELESLRNSTASIITEKENAFKRRVEYVKSEAQKRINEIRELAKDDIRKADEREMQYRGLITKLETLFQEGAVKFLVAAEEQESLMSDMARTLGRKNEFVQLSEKFDGILTESGKVISKMRTRQLGSK